LRVAIARWRSASAATAIFSVLYAVVLNPLPLRDADRLFAVGESYNGALSAMSAGIYVDAEAGTDVFDGLAALQYTNYNLADGAVPERVTGGKVTANYFDVMGVTPLAGRAFTAAEEQPDADRVVVISNRLWRWFGSAPSCRHPLNAAPYTVIGIMPGSFDLTADSEGVDADCVHARAPADARRALPDGVRAVEAGSDARRR
jgi:hypothetical protein